MGKFRRNWKEIKDTIWLGKIGLVCDSESDNVVVRSILTKKWFEVIVNEYYIFTLQTTYSEINTWHVNCSTCWNVNYLRSWNLNTLDLIEQISADRSGIRVNCCCPKRWSVSFSLSIASLYTLLQRIAVWSLIPGNKVNINQGLISADIREQRNTWFAYGSAMPREPVFIWNKTFRMPYKKVS